jgi:hypothetical protein
MSDHVILYMLTHRKSYGTVATPDLRALRKQYQETGTVPIPTEPSKDWRDNKPLSEL